jgi:hypothetical protein
MVMPKRSLVDRAFTPESFRKLMEKPPIKHLTLKDHANALGVTERELMGVLARQLDEVTEVVFSGLEQSVMRVMGFPPGPKIHCPWNGRSQGEIVESIEEAIRARVPLPRA